MDLDDVVATGIGVAQNKLDSEPTKEEKTSFGSKVLRFFITLIWVIVAFGVSALALYSMFAGEASDLLGGDGSSFKYIAIFASLAVGVITFVVPYLRKKGSMTRYCGILAFGDALWWGYITFFG